MSNVSDFLLPEELDDWEAESDVLNLDDLDADFDSRDLDDLLYALCTGIDID